MGGGEKEAQEGGTYVYLWLVHGDVWQRPTQNCKAIILQLKYVIFFNVVEKDNIYVILVKEVYIQSSAQAHVFSEASFFFSHRTFFFPTYFY